MSEQQKIEICAHVEVFNKRKSTREIMDEVGLSQSSVQKTLHKEGYKAYKLQNHQEFRNNDDENRLTFVGVIMNEIGERRLNVERDLCVSDECTIYLRDCPNRQNVREWSRVNHHPVNDCRTQYQRKVNVWAGLFRGQVVGPFFIDGNLNGPGFVRLIQDTVIPGLRRLGMDVSNFFIILNTSAKSTQFCFGN